MLDKLSDLTRKVGSQLLEWRKSGIADGKWEGSQYKAKVDKMAHDLFSNGLKEIDPDIFIVSEEDADSWILNKGKDKYWLIDPLDGTASFAQGYPGFVTQAALMAGQKPLAAIVFAPVFDLMYIAQSNAGAYCNGRKITVNKKDIPQSIIDNYPKPRGIAKDIYKYLRLSKYIECGSIGLKLCRVADGEADLFIKQVTVRPWDLAAAHLVLEEAGGILTDKFGRSIDYSGSYEIQGLIAVTNKEILTRITKKILS